MASPSVFSVKNLLVPAFGEVQAVQFTLPGATGYTVEFNAVTIDSTPFSPQAVTVDTTSVAAGQSVTFSVPRIGYRKTIAAGRVVTFNFPSLADLKISITPSDGISGVSAIFYNFPQFPDWDDVGGSGGVNYLSPAVIAQIAAINSYMPTTTLATVANATTQLLAANPNRKYVSICNNDPALSITITEGAGTDGYVLNPGDIYEKATRVPTSAISMIGTAAGTANKIVVIEGN